MSSLEGEGFRLRRALPEDVDFVVELLRHEEVEPFLAAVRARDPEEVRAEIDRSLAEPQDFGRFVIEAAEGDGWRRAGILGFELANRRSRIVNLGGLAVHPDFRGRRLSDDAARLFQRHLLLDLDYHRLQLEIYGFNERAIRHAERAGFVREGVKRKAYRRHGEWVDGVLFGLVREDLGPATIARMGALAGRGLLGEHVERFNAGVRSGDFGPMLELFTGDAELAFEGVPVGPFRGRDAIAAAYRERPPDDEIDILGVDERPDGSIVAAYGWRRAAAARAGEMRLSREGDRISRLVVAFD